jgi:hypothetical protein
MAQLDDGKPFSVPHLAGIHARPLSNPPYIAVVLRAVEWLPPNRNRCLSRSTYDAQPKERRWIPMVQPVRMNCPQCLSAEGYVRGVSVGQGLRTFWFVCRSCGRTWDGEPHARIDPDDMAQAQPANPDTPGRSQRAVTPASQGK